VPLSLQQILDGDNEDEGHDSDGSGAVGESRKGKRAKRRKK